jgi:predicted AAA+ superfamily ATPase
MSSEIASLLTGRHYTFPVYSLSFREFLNWRNVPHSTDIEKVENKAGIRNAFFEYLEWGGFPEVVLNQSNEKREKILHQYFDDILYKDIVTRYQIRDGLLMQAVAEQYLTQMSSLCSFNRMANILKTSVENVRRYTGFLAEAQLIYLLPKFSYKASIRLTGNQKVYVADTGMRNVMTFRFSQDIGRLAENVVAQELLRRETRDLFYYGNSRECDFLAKQGNTWLPIQVCHSNLADEKTRIREKGGLLAAIEELGVSRGLLLTDDIESDEQEDNIHIQLLPVWKFLLSGG